jgi:hypothetical protein
VDGRELPESMTNRRAKHRAPLESTASELEAALGRRMQHCIEKGTFPLEVYFAMDYFLDGDRLRCRTRILPSQPPCWPEPVMTVEGCYRFQFEQFQELVIEQIRGDVGRDRAALSNLVSLARIDRHRCCELAAEYFAERLESPENSLNDEQHLPFFVLFLHDVDPALPADLVTHTKASSRPAAARLRAKLLDAMQAPQCADELGWLAAQALRDRLEEA